ncbi:MAG: HNH endonuclease [Verrucomicrobiota bacterium]|nr:HNH endonuclease [Verrucomicrobiota bacterium]
MCRLGLVAALALSGSKAWAFDPMLPDPKLTPGRIAASSAESRDGVTAAMTAEVFKRYRIPVDRRGAYKIDHLIPKELGGADEIENLWPQKIQARPYTARRKQVLTHTLRELVANGKLTLADAQAEIREDWISSFIVHIGMVYLEPGAKHRASE